MSTSVLIWILFSGGAFIFFALELVWWAKRYLVARKVKEAITGQALLMTLVFLALTLNLALFLATGVVAAILPEPPTPSPEYMLRSQVLRILLIGGEAFVLLAGILLAVFRRREGSGK